MSSASERRRFVICDQCGKRHEATFSHMSESQGAIFAVVCDDWLTDYYTSEVVRDRYSVQHVSVGAAGLTSRPAVFDNLTQRTVKTFRRTEQAAAERLAERLNEGESK